MYLLGTSDLHFPVQRGQDREVGAKSRQRQQGLDKLVC